MKPLRKILGFLGITIPAFLIAALVLIVVADVIARNFFAMSIMWAQELAVILLAATVWLGLAGAAMQGQLFGITLFVERLPARLAPAALLVSDLLVMAIAVEVIRAAIFQISTSRFTKFLTLGWPKWVVAALLAVGMGLVIAGRLLDIAERFKESRS